MTKENKVKVIAELKEKFSEASHFYITDSSELNVEQINKLRGLCFEKDIEMRVVKNTLVQKALESLEGDQYNDLYSTLKGPTSLMFSEVANAPAKVIEEFRGGKLERPLLKAAFIDSSIYLGNDAVKTLAALKSREELIGDVIMLLQSPAKNVISALKSGGSTIAGLVKALEERAQ